jgi:hypothetical protein
MGCKSFGKLRMLGNAQNKKFAFRVLPKLTHVCSIQSGRGARLLRSAIKPCRYMLAHNEPANLIPPNLGLRFSRDISSKKQPQQSLRQGFLPSL